MQCKVFKESLLLPSVPPPGIWCRLGILVIRSSYTSESVSDVRARTAIRRKGSKIIIRRFTDRTLRMSVGFVLIRFRRMQILSYIGVTELGNQLFVSEEARQFSGLEYEIGGLSERPGKDQLFNQWSEAEPVEVYVNHRQIELWSGEKLFEDIQSKLPGAPRFLLGLLPERKICDYGPWKKMNLAEYGFVTQCMAPTSINDEYLANLLLKATAVQSFGSTIYKNFTGIDGRVLAAPKPIEPPFNVFEETTLFRLASPLVMVEIMFEDMQSNECPNKRDVYGPWKKNNLAEYDFVTQCMAPYLLKANAMLGGLNSMLSVEQNPSVPMVSKVPAFILGMDVSHGSPGQSDVPSIAAVVSLRNWPSISRYRASILAFSRIHLVLCLHGGAKKHKKKTYTKPKKIKHKHKKVKLAVLQFYKVDDNGKVQRLRKECPNAEFGAGTFMANHFDRHYCGKCGLTYVYNKEDGGD